jgi:hypothetical protein
MKLTKILGLAIVAAVAVTAFTGSASAARLHPLVKLCSKRELLLCSAANTLELRGLLKGLQIGTGTLEGTLKEKCTGGVITGITTEEMGESGEESWLGGEIKTLTFSGCEPCTKITSTGGFATKLRHAKEGAEAEKLWFLRGGGNATFEGCPFGINCKFGSESLTPEPYIENSLTEGVINTNKAELKLETGSEFFCGKTGKWNARYLLELELTVGGNTHKDIWPTLCKVSLTCV